jgi:hypothetical protein
LLCNAAGDLPPDFTSPSLETHGEPNLKPYKHGVESEEHLESIRKLR